MRRRSLLAPVLLLVAVACDGSYSTSPTASPPATATAEPTGGDAALTLTSPAFEDGGTIPAKHSCTGDDLSPALEWSGVPEGTTELALSMLDPDADDFPHWFLWGLAPDLTGLEEGTVPEGATQWRDGYFGPCPPAGPEHHYVFTLYALSSPVDLSAEHAENGQPNEVLGAFDGAGPIATAELVGLFGT